MAASRRGGRKHWPLDVYDYVSQRITDPDVAELDMARGLWIRCGRCEDSVLKMGSRFSTSCWGDHRKRLKHQRAVDRLQRKNASRAHTPVPVASPSPARGIRLHEGCSPLAGVDFSTTLFYGAQNDQEFLSLCYEGLHKKKLEQTKFEAEVHDVVNAMTSLITEQQDELDSMRCAVEKNERALDALKAEMHVLRTQASCGNAHQDSQSGLPACCGQRQDTPLNKGIAKCPESTQVLASTRHSRNDPSRPQARNEPLRKSQTQDGRALQYDIRSSCTRHNIQRSTSPSLFSPMHRSGALKRSCKDATTLRSHEKPEGDPFEWDDHDDADEGTRRVLHMSQYA